MNTHDDFRDVISTERENLTRLSDFWNTKVKCDKSIPKDTQGRIRAAVGKTRLLLSEKFKQFEGLIEQSANNTSEKEISINDLQGFWDLVLIQVNEVKEMFRNLDPGNERFSSEYKKLGKSRSRDSELQRDSIKGDTKSGAVSKKKSSSDNLDETEKKINDIMEEEKGRSEAGDLKNKVSLSKL